MQLLPPLEWLCIIEASPSAKRAHMILTRAGLIRETRRMAQVERALSRREARREWLKAHSFRWIRIWCRQRLELMAGEASHLKTTMLLALKLTLTQHSALASSVVMLQPLPPLPKAAKALQVPLVVTKTQWLQLRPLLPLESRRAHPINNNNNLSRLWHF